MNGSVREYYSSSSTHYPPRPRLSSVEQVQQRLREPGAQSLPYFGKDVILRALEPLLHDPTLARALRAYFGRPVRYDGARLVHLTAKATMGNYNPFQW